jgi:hypothetical protein
MTDTYTYRVANLSFSVTFDADDALKERMEPYAPFQTDATDDIIFTIQALAPAVSAKPSLDGCELVVDTTDVGLLMRVYRSAEGAYIVLMSTDTDKDGWCYVHIDNHFTEATLASCGKLSTRSYGLTNALMMLFAFAGATRRTLLFHASVIKERGRGFLFLGKSGTGKSTHSALWLKHIAGTELLNDDNPAVQISPDGTPMVYGTPWSGKTPCYKNDCAPIGGFVRLWQAPKNDIVRLSSVQAYAALLPTVSCMRWERSLADGVNDTLGALISRVPVFSLHCLPDEEAALMSHHQLEEACRG